MRGSGGVGSPFDGFAALHNFDSGARFLLTINIILLLLLEIET